MERIRIGYPPPSGIKVGELVELDPENTPPRLRTRATARPFTFTAPSVEYIVISYDETINATGTVRLRFTARHVEDALKHAKQHVIPWGSCELYAKVVQ